MGKGDGLPLPFLEKRTLILFSHSRLYDQYGIDNQVVRGGQRMEDDRIIQDGKDVTVVVSRNVFSGREWEYNDWVPQLAVAT